MKYSCQYSKEYINSSTEFKNSNGSKESIEKLYDLLYKLEKIDRTKNEDLLLSNVYTLLGFYEKLMNCINHGLIYQTRKKYQNFILWKRKQNLIKIILF
ncbi:hypothetical protein [Aliarcobacter butzleri]|uniref:hypothetical protein n=1 Tax=Aliarcobacter butzleri TaxID=28197 RepID=UPI00102D6A2E|nr:hypothetical protein [Aliarcobacter butzleri]RZV12799.1 hypothetical protein D3M61_11040 [Aliarcobacter butzleri]